MITDVLLHRVCLPILIVAWRLITSGDSGWSFVGSCKEQETDTHNIMQNKP